MISRALRSMLRAMGVGLLLVASISLAVTVILLIISDVTGCSRVRDVGSRATIMETTTLSDDCPAVTATDESDEEDICFWFRGAV